MAPPHPSNPAPLSDSQRLIRLQMLCVTKEDRKKQGFIMEPFTKERIEAKRRCEECKKSIGIQKPEIGMADEANKGHLVTIKFPPTAATPTSNTQTVLSVANAPTNTPSSVTTAPTDSSSSAAERPASGVTLDGKPKGENDKMPACRFHQGKIDAKENKWTCCDQKPNNRGCVGYRVHSPRATPTAQLEAEWQFHKTPPPRNIAAAVRQSVAVSIDCEMGYNDTGDPELIRVSVVDYLTSKVLLDRLVFPGNLRHPNTRHSGVTFAMLHRAKARGQAFTRRIDALVAVWQHVGPTTVVVGHSLQGDLLALRWIHDNIVDTYILERDDAVEEAKKKQAKERKKREEEQDLALATATQAGAPAVDKLADDLAKRLDIVPALPVENDKPGQTAGQQQPAEAAPKKEKGSGSLALTSVTWERLGRKMRITGRHDSVEDALAARDVAEWHANKRASN